MNIAESTLTCLVGAIDTMTPTEFLVPVYPESCMVSILRAFSHATNLMTLGVRGQHS